MKKRADMPSLPVPQKHAASRKPIVSLTLARLLPILIFFLFPKPNSLPLARVPKRPRPQLPKLINEFSVSITLSGFLCILQIPQGPRRTDPERRAGQRRHIKCLGRNTEPRRAAARSRSQGPIVRGQALETWSSVQIVPCNFLDLIFTLGYLFLL